METAHRSSGLNIAVKRVEVVSVVVGVILSVLTFGFARLKEAHAREVEAARPFLELRRSLYLEALKAAAVLSNVSVHTDEEIQSAKKRFTELYVVELSMVEAPGVEKKMIALAREVEPSLLKMSGKQTAAYELAHAIRDSLTESWGIADEMKRPNKAPEPTPTAGADHP